MRLVLYATVGREYEDDLSAMLISAGLDLRVEPSEVIDESPHLACVTGVNNAALMREFARRGTPYLYWDKAYRREGRRSWRVAYRAHQPTEYLTRLKFQGDRAVREGWAFRPWRDKGGHIVLAGSSGKYNEYYGLPDPTLHAIEIAAEIRNRTDRRIVYRPKPSWGGAKPIKNTEFSAPDSRRTIQSDLEGAHAIVTHGSNACFEALLHGIPAIVLGPGVTRPISSTSLDELDNLRLADHDERWQLLSNLAYCQFTVEEFASGYAWRQIESIMEKVDESSIRQDTGR